MTPKNTTCIIHDMFLYRGGAERFNILFAEAINADIAALFFSKESIEPRSLGFSGECRAFGRDAYTGGLRQVYLKWRVLFHTKFLREYSTVIFSNDSLSAIWNTRKDTRKIYYAHSLPRYLFDQRVFYYRKVPILLRPLYILMRGIFEWMYFRELRQIDEIYTNSTNLQKSIKKYLHRESQIIFPPVDTNSFVPSEEKGGYYISFSKLSTLKRVGVVVEAFREMPDKKLLVIYGHNDPQKEEIMNMGIGYENITFLTLTDNNELPRYIAKAIATLFIAKNEDFGMVALESMSCGVPVVGVREGGIQETVIPEETGILLSPDFTPADLISAVERLDQESAFSMKDACIARAQKFSLKSFKKIVQEKFL